MIVKMRPLPHAVSLPPLRGGSETAWGKGRIFTQRNLHKIWKTLKEFKIMNSYGINILILILLLFF